MVFEGFPVIKNIVPTIINKMFSGEIKLGKFKDATTLQAYEATRSSLSTT